MNNGRSKSQNSSSSGGENTGNVYESSDFRSRGGPRVNYQQMHDKYLNLAREALGDGDRVAAEFNYQYADHYLRLIRERQCHAQERRVREQQNTPRESELTKSEEKPTQEGMIEAPLENNDKVVNPIVNAIVGELNSSS